MGLSRFHRFASVAGGHHCGSRTSDQPPWILSTGRTRSQFSFSSFRTSPATDDQLLLLSGPPQAYIFSRILKFRSGQTTQVDERVRLLADVVGSIRSVKLFAWEKHFGREVQKIRTAEHNGLNYYSLLRSTVNAVFFAVPILASVRKS